ncbi:alpha-amylase family glycosyl hydrolase [Persicobacter diffluens]|uniref:Alpha-amylase n=1 Tax=Persicobacter diffluens TaxID=981 RepID=A0AAN4W2J1_9BACT|nr:alpha-amylase [Persicobacter diffluens]
MARVVFFICFFCITAIGFSQSQTPDWVANKPIYEVDISKVTKEGTFEAFRKQIPQIKALGVGIIWLQPINKRGEFVVDHEYIRRNGGVKFPIPESAKIYGRNGCYSVGNHLELDPNYGTEKDFQKLVDAIHKAGMYVIVDFVANHTSWDHPLLKQKEQYYCQIKKDTYAFTAPWKGIAQLDFSQKAVWEYMYKAMDKMVATYGIDGFRTDVGDRIPSDFWNWMKPKLTNSSQLYFLAEGDSPAVYPSHDATYDWYLQPAFWSVIHGKRNVDAIYKILEYEQAHYPEGALRMRHATNHDTRYSKVAYPSMNRYFDRFAFDKSWYSQLPLKDKFGRGLEAFMVLCATLPNSQPMILAGQEYNDLHIPEPVPYGYREVKPFYSDLFNTLANNDILVDGSFEAKEVAGFAKMLVFDRELDGNKITVCINLAQEAVSLPNFALGIEVGAQDIFTGESHSYSGVIFEPMGYQIFLTEQKGN